MSVVQAQVRYYNYAADSATVTSLLDTCRDSLGPDATPGEHVDCMARCLMGRPYVAHTLEAKDGETEALTVNLQQLDCTTFVENLIALARTSSAPRADFGTFTDCLRRLRYRDGVVDGYSSRLHYIADWADHNIADSVLSDIASLIPCHAERTLDINFMTAHRNAYKALADSAEYRRIAAVESRLAGKSFAYIPQDSLDAPEVVDALKTGDILAFVSTLPDLDVTHMGVLVMTDGVPRVIHASSTARKVVLTEGSLADFVRGNPYWTGARVFRLR